MIRLIVAAALFATQAHAENCKAPNVERVVEGIDPTPPQMSFALPILHLPAVSLACPAEGPCGYVLEDKFQAPVRVICLTPDEHAAALERGR